MRTMGLAGLDELVEVLGRAGYEVFGPRVRDGAIVLAPIGGVADLPQGVGDTQDAAHYRLREREDARVFGYSTAVQGLKPVLFPSHGAALARPQDADRLRRRGARRRGPSRVRSSAHGTATCAPLPCTTPC